MAAVEELYDHGEEVFGGGGGRRCTTEWCV